MIHVLRILLDWSEVWAPLIPIGYYLFHRNQPAFLKPVILYLFIAFFVNLAGDLISDYKAYMPFGIKSNNPLYNAHSIIRFACFSYFFAALGQKDFSKFRFLLPIIGLLVIVVNFGWVESFGNPDHLSGNLLASEAYLLLIYCMLYYLSKLRNDADDISGGADFWVVTGLSIYVVVNFFVFLFYVPMLNYDAVLAERIWDVHNIAYILLCIFITRAFYDDARHQFAI